MRHLIIRLLGPFEVIIDGEPVIAFEYAKVRALLAYLAVEMQRPHLRAELATLFWPDQSERAARASLSQALTTLRNVLGDKHAQRPLLLADAQSVQLDSSATVEVDVTQFLDILRTADNHAHHTWRTCPSCAERLEQALNFYRGHFLADVRIADSDVFDEWAGPQREHLRQRMLSTLERLSERAQWRGAYQEALMYVQRMVVFEPLLEGHQRTYIRLLALNGEVTAALAQYRQLRILLDQELATEPEDDTTALFDQIRNGDITNLHPAQPMFVVPIPPTSMVNRTAELQTICTQLRDLKVRAVTITGTGGIGKTRLALEVAHMLRYDFEGGVYVVELAGLSDATLMADAIAQALGVKEQPGYSVSVALKNHLGMKAALVILDNFEHVISAAPLISELLAACPALTVLVTSRTALNIRVEQQFILEPLTDEDAVRLFVQRAQAVGAKLAMDEASTAVYSAICRRLDRLPLAIELIAVRARTLAPLDLLRQLDQPLQALVHGPRDLPTRHQALRNAIQWSYDLLDVEEQRIFMSLGVFAGGCTVDAVQAVLDDEIAVLPVLEQLHGASLLQQQIVDGETRFLMLETIREFALEQLAVRGGAASVNDRHMEWYAHFSMTAYVELIRASAPRWRARVAAEQDNLRAAFRWAMQQQAYATALRIATGVWRFHWMTGLLREGLERLEAALPYREQVAWDIQSNALRAAGTLAMGLNDFPRARQWLEAAVEAGRRCTDLRTLQPALTNLGQALLEQGELASAQCHLEQSIALARQAEDPHVVKFPLGILASLHLRLGNYDKAQAMSEETLHINQVCQDPEGTANALYTLASIVHAKGDTRRAQHLAMDALLQHRSLNHQLGMGLDYALLGNICYEQDDIAGALEHYHDCLKLWRDRENNVNSASVVDKIAALYTYMGDEARGAKLLGATAAIRDRARATLACREQVNRDEISNTCRTMLGEVPFAAAWSEGYTLSPEQVLDLALAPPSPKASHSFANKRRITGSHKMIEYSVVARRQPILVR